MAALLTRPVIEGSDAHEGTTVRRLVSLLLTATFATVSLGQDRSPGGERAPQDSLRSYDLEEIVVASGAEQAPSSSTLQRVTIAGTARQNAAAIDAAARLVPAAYVQTNSRGETLIYLRNVGERQVGVFFDGALLNIPWDNRVDLSLVPSAIVGSITVAKGAPAVVYGTNVLGGALNFTTLEIDASHGEVSAAFGSPASVQASGTER